MQFAVNVYIYVSNKVIFIYMDLGYFPPSIDFSPINTTKIEFIYK